VNLGHAGLHTSAYCHVTSPIRRYPDLVCPRALLSTLGAAERAPRASELAELGSWCSERERAAMELERTGDDIASCFALERLLARDRPGQVLDGEITGLISAGAFVAFAGPPDGGAAPAQAPPPFEGMVPVRRLRVSRAAEQRRARDERDRPSPGGARGTPSRRGEGEGAREWWELNEEGTIMYGERSGAALRLGDAMRVRVERIDALRGRVDLEPAG
jgi:ribonuclease R